MRKSSLPGLKKKAWKLLSEYIRRKDADEGGTVECYTCRKLFHWKELQGGHFVPGRSGSVLLDARIVRPQCVRCNVLLGGAYHAFTLRMIDEVGREKVEEYLALKHQVKKWNRSDLEAFIEEYKRKLDELTRNS